MDQKMFLAIALSMLVMIGFYAIFPPPQPPPRPVAEEQATQPDSEQQAAQAPGPEAAAAPGAPAVSAEPERLIAVDTPNYRALVSTRGGKIVSLQLKHYAVGVRHFDWGDLAPFLRDLPYIGDWLSQPDVDPSAEVEMVRQDLAGPGLLDIRFRDDPALSAEATSFRADRERVSLSADSAPETLVLTGTTAPGITIRKTITFDADSYVLRYGASVINYGPAPAVVRVQHWFGEGPVPPAGHANAYGHRGPMFSADGDVKTEDADDVAPKMLLTQLDWIAVAEPYFLSAAKNESPVAHAMYESEERLLPGGEYEWLARYGMELPEITLAPNKQIESSFRLYLGPKAEGELEKFGGNLPDSLDMNLGVLAKPLLAMLRWFYGFAGNYGVAIILLTIVVRVAMFPLTYKGMLSMKRMQKLQPKMMALRDKFKNDREKMNREMMGLYKRYKVNPLGGCLPILLQLPIFFALYSALSSAIELRHAPFFGWLSDLSAMDGLFVLPVLMGASMVIQQRLTPTTADPVQAKIMQWMPVIFTLFMFTFPSGLTLYWFTSNLLSIGQQLVINRVNVPEPVEQPG